MVISVRWSQLDTSKQLWVEVDDSKHIAGKPASHVDCHKPMPNLPHTQTPQLLSECHRDKIHKNIHVRKCLVNASTISNFSLRFLRGYLILLLLKTM